jgi:hypothetical protein
MWPVSEMRKSFTLQTELCDIIKALHHVLIFWGFTLSVVSYGLLVNNFYIIIGGLFLAFFSTNILTAYEISYDYKNRGCSKIILKCILNSMFIGLAILIFLLIYCMNE